MFSYVPLFYLLLAYLCSSFFFYAYGTHRDLHSFPTRRSSDLEARDQIGERALPAPAHADQRHHLPDMSRSEEHTSELQSRVDLVCRLLLEKKKTKSCTQKIP